MPNWKWKVPAELGEQKAIAYDRNGSVLATGGSDGVVRLWNAQSGAQVAAMFGHTDAVNSVAVSSDGRFVASGSKDKTAMLWDVKTGSVLVLRGFTDIVTCVAFSPDGKQIATTSRHDVRVRMWDVATGLLKRTIEKLSWEYGWSVAFSPDGDRLVVAAGSNESYTLKLYDVWTGLEIASDSNWTPFYNVAFAPHASKLAVSGGYSGRQVLAYDASDLSKARIIDDLSLYASSVSIASDSKTVAASFGRSSIRLWNIDSNVILDTWSTFPDQVYSVAFDPSGSRIAIAGTVSGVADGTSALRSVSPASFTLRRGQLMFGSLESLWSRKDGQDLRIGTGPVSGKLESPITLEFEARDIGSAPGAISFGVYAFVDANDLIQRVDLFDFSTARYDTASMNERILPKNDAKLTQITPAPPYDRFFGPHGELRARVRLRPQTVPTSVPFEGGFDWVYWTVGR